MARDDEASSGGGRGGPGVQVFFPNSKWAQDALKNLAAAWQQQEIAIPQEWAGRRITLHAEYINSFAAVYVHGQKVGEMRYPWGDVELTSACRPGSKHMLSMLVVAMPLKGVMLSYSDSNRAKEVPGVVWRKGIVGDIGLGGVESISSATELYPSILARAGLGCNQRCGGLLRPCPDAFQ